MSIFQKVFQRLEADKQARQQQLAKNYAGLCQMIAEQVQGRIKSDEEAIAAFVEDCIHAGIASPEEIQKLHDAAVRLHGYIEASEVPQADAEAATKRFREIADRCNAEIAAARQVINQAEAVNAQRNSSRQKAQQLVNQHPELACMFKGCSWQPRIQPVAKPTGAGAPLIIEENQDGPTGGGGSVAFRDDAPTGKGPKAPK